MGAIRLIAVLAALLMAGAMSAAAQNQPQGEQQPPAPAPAKPYKPVAITLPKPLDDAGLEAMRKQLAAAAQKKDRAALAKMVVAQGFFWERETGNAADKKKSGIDNLANALGLANKDAAGWDILASYAEESTASPSLDHKDAVCAPADPTFNGQEFEALLKATETDPGEWGYPVSADIGVHAASQANAPLTGKLGLALVHVMPEATSNAPSYLRIVTPDGKIGFVSVDSIAPIGNDQMCYVKDGGAWKIGGYVGGGESQ
jgi:hypothetical protein